KADGLHISGNVAALSESIDKHAPKLIIGGGNAADRHHAFEIGEAIKLIPYFALGQLDNQNLTTSATLLPFAPLATIAGA
ncbi:hypothetical protein ACC759_38385, partial [Rhizobium ruizarguesonis]